MRLSRLGESKVSDVPLQRPRVASGSRPPHCTLSLSRPSLAPPPCPPLDKSRGFLALTFTSALCHNVQSKIKGSDASKERQTVGAEASEFPDKSALPRRYLHEVCLKVQPCDVVLHSPLLVSLAKIINIVPTAKVVDSTPTPTQPISNLEGNSAKLESTTDEQTPLLNIFTSQLPLLYVTASSLRVFMPLEENIDDSAALNRGK